MESVDDCLSMLGLSRGASWDEVNEAYRDLVRVWHPDRFQNDERLKKRAGEQTVLLNQAIKTLRADYNPQKGPSKVVESGLGTAKKRATQKQEFHSSLHPNERAERNRAFKLAPLLVYQRPVASTSRIIGSLAVLYLGYFCVVHAELNSGKMVVGCLLSLLSMSSIARNICMLFVRRPMIRVDAFGLSSVETGVLGWTDLSKVWTFVQASTPALAIECSDHYIKAQPLSRRVFMRIRHAFRRAHIVVTCAGLDAHPNDVVRAINAQHLTGNTQAPQVREKSAEEVGVPWCRLIAAASAIAVLGRCVLGTELTIFDLAIYFVVFAGCQTYDIATRLMQVPDRA